MWRQLTGRNEESHCLELNTPIFQKGAALLSATSCILTDPGSGFSVNVDEVFV